MYENIYLIYGKQLFLRQLRNARELGPCKITVLYCNLQLSRNLFIPPKFDHLDYLSIYFFLLIIFPRFGGIFFFCNNSFKSDFPYKGRISHDIVSHLITLYRLPTYLAPEKLPSRGAWIDFRPYSGSHFTGD